MMDIIEIMASAHWRSTSRPSSRAWDDLKPQERTQKRNSIAAAIAALTEAGFAIVPVTPTEAMVQRGARDEPARIRVVGQVWADMIEAGSVKT